MYLYVIKKMEFEYPRIEDLDSVYTDTGIYVPGICIVSFLILVNFSARNDKHMGCSTSQTASYIRHVSLHWYAGVCPIVTHYVIVLYSKNEAGNPSLCKRNVCRQQNVNKRHLRFQGHFCCVFWVFWIRMKIAPEAVASPIRRHETV